MPIPDTLHRPMTFYRILFLVFVIMPVLVQAAEWRIYGNVDQTISYDDNVRMTNENQQGSLIYRIIPTLNLLHDSEQFDLEARATYGTQRYSDIEGRNHDIQRYSLASSYLVERSQFGLDASYDITPRSEIAEEDDGNFASNGTRTSWSVRPSYSYQLTELDNLDLSVVYSQRNYSDRISRSNEYYVVSTGWSRIWNQRFNSTAEVVYGHYESSGVVNTKSDVYGFDFGSYYDINQAWATHGIFGVRVVDSDTIVVDPEIEDGILNDNNTSVGYNGEVGITYTGQQFSADLYYNQGLQPSSRGTLNQQRRVGLILGYDITERLSTSFSAVYRETEAVSVDVPLTRKNLDISPRLSWIMARDWIITLAYRYRSQKRDQLLVEDQDADSNSVLLSINYDWDGMRISR